MKKELKNLLGNFLALNKENKHKILLGQYMQEAISKYACDINRPAEQIKGMNVLYRDIMTLDDRLFGEK